MLIVFGGLPASGKSTLSRRVAQELQAVYLRVDTLEHALKQAGFQQIFSEGYDMAYRVAADNLALGVPVVADSVNPVSATRIAWRNTAAAAKVPVIELEVVCSDKQEQRRRFEARSAESDHADQPTWDDVLARDYEPWLQARIVIDTAAESPDQSFCKAMALIKAAL